ncbi:MULTISPECIES: HEPN domain-containing protein [Pantoea]|uniref:HEPN domain-containing protein n=1 Tax=Enterobacter agglomerans TaxID=549 RepID=A0ACC5PND5_ENTAG|nr:MULTISPECIES: HEPN domain-containing protein [Pantoea]MBD8126551.1 HEPN domain-containing protein [Pantoea agglomerans]
MSIKGREFLDFANRCLEQGDEIAYRNAVGRAYYGAYHEVSGILEKAVFVHTHKDIRDYLVQRSWLKGNEPFDKMTMISLGSRLKQMHTNRVSADYDLTETFSDVDAKAALIQAQQFIDDVDNMFEKVYPKPPAA